MPPNDNIGIVNPVVEKYLEELARPRDKVLSDLEKDAEVNSMTIIGPLCGNILTMIATSAVQSIFSKLGQLTGYSGILFARVAQRNSGKITTIEMDPDRIAIAKKSFSDAMVLIASKFFRETQKKSYRKLQRSRREDSMLSFWTLETRASTWTCWSLASTRYELGAT